MTPEELQGEVRRAEGAVTQQADAVRVLKSNIKEGKADKSALDGEVAKLKALKEAAAAAQKRYEESAEGGPASSKSREAFRTAVETLLRSRFFVIPSFKIYNGVAGFFDYGPPGCALKQNLTQLWRHHFILEEGMLEVECPAVTPEIVLEASGHVQRFSDFMVRDLKTRQCYRADHLLKAVLEAALEDRKAAPSPPQRKELERQLATLDELDGPGLDAALRARGARAPDTGNELSEAFPFNLMFRTSIGPGGDQVGFLRPETAQGIFVNFGALLYYNGGKLPFAAAQIGQSYRNEIAPRQGLLRVREFTQAEIEHFCNPEDKSHPKFAAVAALSVPLFSRALQQAAGAAQPKPLGEAVGEGMVANETLGYFIGRTFLYLTQLGLDPRRVRFRQHLEKEMAHYALDCWDAEVECTYGWVECVGLADRSAYDLTAHAKMSKVELSAREDFPEPRTVERRVLVPNKGLIGRTFLKEAKAVQDALAALGEDDLACMGGDLAQGRPHRLELGGGRHADITPEMASVTLRSSKESGRNFTPSVIEPSFGIGRILYCLMEHAYVVRPDGERTFFRLPPVVAPYKATVFPLIQKLNMAEKARHISRALAQAGLSSIVDTTSASIGKRYARTDELGVPFGITIDGQTAADDTATLRERDGMTQVRLPVAELASTIRRLVDGALDWSSLAARYPVQASPADAESRAAAEPAAAGSESQEGPATAGPDPEQHRKRQRIAELEAELARLKAP